MWVGAGRGGGWGVKIIPAWKKCLFVMAESEITQLHNTLAMILFFIKFLSVVGMNVGIFFKSALLCCDLVV